MSLFEFSAEYAMFPRGGLILCALSGGADSMFLAANLLERREELGYTVAAAHFDHGLRACSQLDARFVEDWCAQQGIPCIVGHGNVAAEAARSGTGIEETARTLRYAFLQETAEMLGADVIATAHTADDNAETLLMNLVRGSGLDGLCGIPPRRGNIVRPMLTTTRAEIERWLSDRGIPHVEDETNSDETYTRNFIRQQVMPLLNQVNPKAAEHMTEAAGRLRRDRDVLAANALRIVSRARPAEEGWVIAVKEFEFVPDPLAIRAVRELLLKVGGKQLSAAHLTATLKLMRGEDPSAMLHLPNLLVRRVYGEVLFTPWSECGPPLLEQNLDLAGTTVWGHWTITCTPELCPASSRPSDTEFWLARNLLSAPLSVRPRKEGDTLSPPGRPGKTIKKWFIDEKIPRADRDLIPILWDGNQVAAAGLLGPSAALLATAGQPALHITLQKEKGVETDAF